MSDESPNETSTIAKPVFLRRRRFPVKTAVTAVVAVVLMGHMLQAVRDRFEAWGAGTILPAKIRAARLFSMVAEAPGSVLSISATLGDKVQPGQELAALEDPELALALERAKARFAAAEKRRQALANGGPRIRLFAAQYSTAEAAWKNACSRANDFNKGDPDESEYAAARARTKSVGKLVADGLATSEELERSRREEEDALRTLSAAREHRANLQRECDSSLAQLQVAKLQRDLNQHSAVESAEAEYADALAQVDSLTGQSKKLHVIAHGAGTVLSVPVAAGDHVTAGAVLFQIGDLSGLSVEVPVGGRIARQIHKGDKVLVRLPMDPPRQVEASVSAVLLAPGQDSNSYVVRVVIANPDSSVILAGLEGEVVFRHTDVEFRHSGQD
jgi:multidrug resistance efflux pump